MLIDDLFDRSENLQNNHMSHDLNQNVDAHFFWNFPYDILL